MESVLHCDHYSCSIIAVSHLAIRAITAIYIPCYVVPKLCCPLWDSAHGGVILLSACPLGLQLCGDLWYEPCQVVWEWTLPCEPQTGDC